MNAMFIILFESKLVILTIDETYYLKNLKLQYWSIYYYADY